MSLPAPTPASLQRRLALALGLGISLLWIAMALVTAALLRAEMNRVFDSALELAAQRLLPLAALDVIGRDQNGTSQRMSTLHPREETFSYLVRDAQGRVLLRSSRANDADFPPFDGSGFRQTSTHRLYYDSALKGTLTIAVAEPLSHRASLARKTLMVLGLPLLVVVPLGVLGIILVVRRGLEPIRNYSTRLATRGTADFRPVAGASLPAEMAPVAVAVNELLERVRRTLDAERHFAANAAHELRTPMAAALAQAQRLLAETGDPAIRQRAAGIEASLKRLNHLAAKLLQLARAEGGRLRTGIASDLTPILRLVVGELDPAGTRVLLETPPEPVLSDIDPDAFAILARNLIENAQKHGTADSPVQVALAPDGAGGGRLRVTNRGPVVAADILERLATRFERGDTLAGGTGLGIPIAQAIATGTQGTLTLRSPIPGRADGFEAVYEWPAA